MPWVSNIYHEDMHALLYYNMYAILDYNMLRIDIYKTHVPYTSCTISNANVARRMVKFRQIAGTPTARVNE